MHLIADATDVEDDIILAVAVDQAFELANHDDDSTARELPSPLRGGVGGGGLLGQCDSGLPPSPTLPRKGGGRSSCVPRLMPPPPSPAPFRPAPDPHSSCRSPPPRPR